MENKKRQNENLALLGTAHSLNHSIFVIIPPLVTLIIAGLGVTKFEIGIASTLASMIYGAGALLGGPLGDKVGEAKAISICLMMSGLPAPILLLTGSTYGFYVYVGTLAFMAFWASFYHPIANSFISKVFKIKVSEAMGLHGVGGTLGTVLTPTVAWFLAVSFGWPWAFIFFAALTILIAFVFSRRAVQPTAPSPGNMTIFDVLRTRELWTILILNIAIGLFMKGVELFFPTFLNEYRGIDPMWASIAFTVLLMCGVPGQWVGGKTAGIFGSKKIVIMTMAGTLVALISLLLVPTYLFGIAIFIGLYGFAFYAHQPALNAMISHIAPHNQRGAVFGIYFFTNFGLGSISQAITGYMADTYGLDSAFILLTLFAGVAFLLSLRLPAPTKKE